MTQPLENYKNEMLRNRALALTGKYFPEEVKLRDLIEKGCYSDIFTVLRALPAGKRAEMINVFYGDFPNGEELGRYVNRVIGIEWLMPKRSYSTEELELRTRAITRAFILPDVETVVTEDDNVAGHASRSTEWIAAKESAMALSAVAASKAGRTDARGSAWASVSGSILNHANSRIRWDMAGCATYIVVHDSPVLSEKYLENPFEKLVDVYELGLWPAGLIEDNGQREFVVWHPKPVS